VRFRASEPENQPENHPMTETLTGIDMSVRTPEDRFRARKVSTEVPAG
jgi:hypothetical protein